MSVECDTTDTGDSELPHSENKIGVSVRKLGELEDDKSSIIIEFAYIPYAQPKKHLWWKVKKICRKVFDFAL